MAAARADRLATEGLVERMRQFSRLTLLLVLEAVNQVVRDVLDPDNYVLVEAGMVPE
jgi:hypothetical protein